MKSLILLAAPLAVALLAGCDGHARLLYLQPATAIRPPWGVASVVVPVEGSKDVVAIVSKVAADLGLRPDPKEGTRWSAEIGGQHTFALSAKKEDGGYWTVSLVGWPTSHRSRQSIQAEALIRDALKRPSEASEPTANP